MTCLALFIVRMGGSLVDFLPELFGLPVVELVLQFAVEVLVVPGVELQVATELSEVLLCLFTCLRLDKTVKKIVAGIDRVWLVGHCDGRGLEPAR